MISMNPLPNKSSNKSSDVRIKDFSKYGTFVNNSTGSKEKVHEIPNKETTLKEGDLISFGTGNATYRWIISCGLHFAILGIWSSILFYVKRSLKDLVLMFVHW